MLIRKDKTSVNLLTSASFQKPINYMCALHNCTEQDWLEASNYYADIKMHY